LGKDLIPPGMTYLVNNIISKDNILGAAKEEGARWAKDLDLPRQAKTIFFAGCGYQYSSEIESLMGLSRKMDKSAVGSELPMRLAGWQKKFGVDLAGVYRKVASRGEPSEAQVLRDAVKVLQKLGINVGYLAENEPCCSAPLYFTGQQQEFTKKARITYQKMKSASIENIIGIVPSCTYALRELFPKFVEGFDITVKHFIEVVAEKIPGRELKYPQQVKVGYHDPCQLGRYLGITGLPRQVLKSIKNIELVEPVWTKEEWSTCCGGGGGFEAVFPELSEILAVNRAKELAETGAEIIVTHCPGCIMQLKSGLKAIKKQDIEVLDMAQVMAAALGEG